MIFGVVAGALFVGIVAILLIARFAPRSPADSRTDAQDFFGLTADDFGALVLALVQRLGLEVLSKAGGTDGVLDLTLREPRPLIGGRILLHATPLQSQGPVTVSEVLAFADAEPGTLKGIFIALAGFAPEARVAAREGSATIELVDAAALMTLVREHASASADLLKRSGAGAGRTPTSAA